MSRELSLMVCQGRSRLDSFVYVCHHLVQVSMYHLWSIHNIYPPTDGDFEPPVEEEDDEETIEVEEQQEGNDAESHRREIELLKEEGLLPLDQLLSTLNLPQVQTWRESFSNKFRFLNTINHKQTQSVYG